MDLREFKDLNDMNLLGKTTYTFSLYIPEDTAKNPKLMCVFYIYLTVDKDIDKFSKLVSEFNSSYNNINRTSVDTINSLKEHLNKTEFFNNYLIEFTSYAMLR